MIRQGVTALADHSVWAPLSAASIAPACVFARRDRIGGSSRPSRDQERVMENVVRVLSTLALKGAVRNLAGLYQAARGPRTDPDFTPTLAVRHRIPHPPTP